MDYDPGSGCFYEPIDLNDPNILAQDRLPPSEGNPQFHQQMVYAVAMTTVRNFERAQSSPVWLLLGKHPRYPSHIDIRTQPLYTRDRARTVPLHACAEGRQLMCIH